MRALYIKLINNKGLFDGLGTDTVEIDLSKFQTGKIIMILGENGSGKSSLLRDMNPYFVKSNFLEDKPCEKHFHVEANGSIYKIRHKMSEKGKVSSWIEKDGTELNKNGGVRTFKETLEKELYFNQDFFKIGLIGSEVEGFIEETSSERKTFASKFIPNIEPYIQRHKQAKEKIKELKKHIAVLAAQIEELGDSEKLKEEREALEKAIIAQKEVIQKYTDQIAKDQAHLNILWNKVPKSVNQTLTNTVKAEVIELERSLENVIDHKENLLKSINHIVSTFDKIDAAIDKNKENRNTEIEARAEYIAKRDATQASITSNRNAMNQAVSQRKMKQTKLTQLYANSKDLISIREELANAESEIAKILEEFPALNNFKNPTKQFFNTFQTAVINNAKSIQDIVNDYHANPRFALMIAQQFNGQYDLSKISFESEMVCKRVDQLDRELNVAKLEIQELESRVKNADILKQRPGACRIDNCPFIANAMRYHGSDEKLVITQQRVSDLDSEKVTISQKIKDLKDLEQIISKFEQIRKAIISNPTISRSPIYIAADTDPVSFIEFALNKFSFNKYTRMGALENLVNFIEVKNDLSSKVNTMSGSISLIDGLKTDVEELDSTIEKYSSTIEAEEKDLAIYSDSVMGFDKALSGYDDNIKRLQSVKNELANLDAQTKELDDKRKQSEEVDAILEEAIPLDQATALLDEERRFANKELTDLEQRLPSIISKIESIEQHQSKIDKVNKEYADYQTIAEVSDPARGYPLFLIKQFLLEPKRLTNELLNFAYRGKFNIDFDISEKDFLIPVKKSNGNDAKDVLEISSGQRAMVKTALCFALINKFIGEYNIPALDELDAFLDVQNRRCFLEILKMQIKTLGIEQLFVISHNDEFFTEKDLGLILFRGHTAPITSEDFMQRATIIDDFTK